LKGRLDAEGVIQIHKCAAEIAADTVSTSCVIVAQLEKPSGQNQIKGMRWPELARIALAIMRSNKRSTV